MTSWKFQYPCHPLYLKRHQHRNPRINILLPYFNGHCRIRIEGNQEYLLDREIYCVLVWPSGFSAYQLDIFWVERIHITHWIITTTRGVYKSLPWQTIPTGINNQRLDTRTNISHTSPQRGFTGSTFSSGKGSSQYSVPEIFWDQRKTNQEFVNRLLFF